MTVDKEKYKDGMSRIASTVTVIATDGMAGKAGITATAVTSVTDSPATLLVCINQNTGLDTTIKENGGLFSVNVLGKEMEAISNRFAGYDKVSQEERFELGQWDTTEGGHIYNPESEAVFLCKLVDECVIGTHNVVYGEVLDVVLSGKEKSPLLYFDRVYRRI